MPVIYTTKWKSNKYSQIIDVRSPIEYFEDHIPNSINLPVLNNKERTLIGMIYKNKNSFKAKKLGASLVSKNIAKYIKNKLINKPGYWKPLIYCWRGGQRSKAFAITLSEIGWQVYIIKGGYKTYRTSVMINLNEKIKNSKFIILRGPTGSAKTKILKILEKKGCPILNLEKLANHKGSLLGKDLKHPQPSQKYFESLLYNKLNSFKKNKPILIESESSKIGKLFLPSLLLKQIENSQCIDINASLEARTEFLVKDYSNFVKNKNNFTELFSHAKIRLGKSIVSKWEESLYKKNWHSLALQLMNDYYDPLYSHKKKGKNNIILESYYFKKLEYYSINKFCNYIKNKYFN